jgi:hypothetical protein
MCILLLQFLIVYFFLCRLKINHIVELQKCAFILELGMFMNKPHSIWFKRKLLPSYTVLLYSELYVSSCLTVTFRVRCHIQLTIILWVKHQLQYNHHILGQSSALDYS